MYSLDMSTVIEYLPLMVKGMSITIKFSILSIFFGTILGVIVALGKMSSKKIISFLCCCYIEWVRGTPLLIQLFFIYFGLGVFINIPATTAGILSLSLFSAAYIAEIIRSGVKSIDRGQYEAGYSLGMDKWKVMTYVIFPQAIKKVLPSLAGQFISLIKDSSLLSVIAIADVTFISRQIVSTNFKAFEIFITVSVFYFGINLALSQGVSTLERRLAQSD